MSNTRCASIAVICAVALLVTWEAPAGPPPFGPAPVQPVGELKLPVAALTREAKPVLAHDRLDDALNAVADAPDPLGEAARRGFRVEDGRLHVTVVARDEEATAGLQTWLVDAGARFVLAAGPHVNAYVDLATLAALERHPDVVVVRRPTYHPKPDRLPDEARLRPAILAAGTYTTEALGPMNATAWHNAGLTGQGVKVGVIDSGFGDDNVHWDQLLGTDLPVAAKVHTQTFGNVGMYSSEHGLGCAEIIYDVAPGVEMYLAAFDGTTEAMVSAANWMRQNGVKVISVSQGWLTWGPGDGTGVLANAVNTFVQNGGVWVNSAGNSRLAHWQGVWRDDNADSWLEFGTGADCNPVTTDGTNLATIPAGTGIRGALIWNRWTNPTVDLELELYHYNSATSVYTKVAESTGTQAGQAGQRPTEEFYYEAAQEGVYCYAIKWYTQSASPAGVHVEMFNRFDSNPLRFNVQEGSIMPPGDTQSAITVAAIDAESPYALKAYSSKGPVNGPGGAITGGFAKPDVAGYASVSSHAYGPRANGGFGGTSAACPHAAGAAALVLSGYPAYTPTQVKSYLESSAQDMGTTGKDSDYGSGRLRLGTPPSSACTAPGTPGNLHSSAASVSSGQTYTLSWNAAGSADGYEIQESTSASFAGASSYTLTGTSRAFAHSPAAVTTYYYRVRATRTCNAQSAWSASATVNVAGGGSGGGAYNYWIQVASLASGAGGSQWRTDLGVLNTGSATANLTFRFWASGNPTRTFDLAGRNQAMFRDIVSQFGLTGSAALQVSSNQPVLVSSRTYNQAATGTFGQSYDGYTVEEALAAGTTVYLGHLTENASYRTNIAVTNGGAAAASVRITLMSNTGATLGSAFTLSLTPGQRLQENQPFRVRGGQTSMERGYAKVEILSGNGVIVSASVIDNNTGDPTTILPDR